MELSNGGQLPWYRELIKIKFSKVFCNMNYFVIIGILTLDKRTCRHLVAFSSVLKIICVHVPLMYAQAVALHCY